MMCFDKTASSFIPLNPQVNYSASICSYILIQLKYRSIYTKELQQVKVRPGISEFYFRKQIYINSHFCLKQFTNLKDFNVRFSQILQGDIRGGDLNST